VFEEIDEEAYKAAVDKYNPPYLAAEQERFNKMKEEYEKTKNR
jgi:hypothetical protein